MSTQISDYICYALVGFNVLSIQAHLTDRFTPGFSKNLAERLPQHNKATFSWAGVSDSGLRAFFIFCNAILTYLLSVPSLRSEGLVTAAAMLLIGLKCDYNLNESPIPHVALISLVGGAWWMR